MSDPTRHHAPSSGSPPTTSRHGQAHKFRDTVEEVRRLLQDAHAALCFLAESALPSDPAPRETPSTKDELETLSIAQAQELLQVSRSTVYALLNSGALEWTRVGQRRRILRSTLLRYLQSNTQAS